MESKPLDPEYHPAFGHRRRHDHHRRARRLLVGAFVSLALGMVSLYWASEGFWGERQRDVARVVGWVGLGAGGLLLVVGAVAWFAVDDDEHKDEG